jgi:hypothetical protein
MNESSHDIFEHRDSTFAAANGDESPPSSAFDWLAQTCPRCGTISHLAVGTCDCGWRLDIPNIARRRLLSSRNTALIAAALAAFVLGAVLMILWFCNFVPGC